jgi:hypothetical protein
MSAPSAIQPSSPFDLLRAALCGATAGDPWAAEVVCERLVAADPWLTPLVRATVHALAARLQAEHLPVRVLPGDPTDLDAALDRLLPGGADAVWEKLELAFGALAHTVLDRDCGAPPPDPPARPHLLEVVEHAAATLEVVARRDDLVDGLLTDAARRMTGLAPSSDLKRSACEEPGCLRDFAGFLCDEPGHEENDEGCFNYPATDRCEAVCDWHGSSEEWQASHPEPPNRPGVDCDGHRGY